MTAEWSPTCAMTSATIGNIAVRSNNDPTTPKYYFFCFSKYVYFTQEVRIKRWFQLFSVPKSLARSETSQFKCYSATYCMLSQPEDYAYKYAVQIRSPLQMAGVRLLSTTSGQCCSILLRD